MSAYLAMSREAIVDAALAAPRPHNRITTIQIAIAARYDVTLHALLSQRRSRHLAHARQAAMWLARQATQRSYAEIGRLFGNRDHTTVIHGIRAVEARMARDPEFDAEMRALLIAFLPVRASV